MHHNNNVKIKTVAIRVLLVTPTTSLNDDESGGGRVSERERERSEESPAQVNWMKNNNNRRNKYARNSAKFHIAHCALIDENNIRNMNEVHERYLNMVLVVELWVYCINYCYIFLVVRLLSHYAIRVVYTVKLLCLSTRCTYQYRIRSKNLPKAYVHTKNTLAVLCALIIRSLSWCVYVV